MIWDSHFIPYSPYINNIIPYHTTQSQCGNSSHFRHPTLKVGRFSHFIPLFFSYVPYRSISVIKLVTINFIPCYTIGRSVRSTTIASVLQIPTTPTTTPIIPNRREMGEVPWKWKYNYDRAIARYRQKVYKSII